MATDPLVSAYQQEVRLLSEALAVAIQDREVWARVACWNGSQKVPHRCVADVLNRVQDERQQVRTNDE